MTVPVATLPKTRRPISIGLAVILTAFVSFISQTSAVLAESEQTKNELSSAVTVGDLESVKRLVDDGADPMVIDRNGVTPFQLATIRGFGKIADFLVSRGASRSQPIPPGEKITERLLERIVNKHSPGAAVLVSQDGKILFREGYGLADREEKRKVQPDTKFRIGSVSKQFTAAAILKLQEQEKLSVNDKLSKHLPEFPRGDDVTLRHLLTHTSGIHSYTSKPDFMSKVVSPIKPEQLIDTFKDDPFDFEPGEKWSYSNSGYFLLGHIVSKVSGKSLGAFLHAEFFKPLGMTNTGVYRNDAPPAGQALGYSFDNGELKRATDWDMSWAGGAGALYSTIDDLNRWNEQLFAGKVLNRTSLESAFARATTSDGQKAGYGYGWGIATHRGLDTISHGGGLHGFLSSLTRYPDANLTVVVLANASPPAPDLAPAQLARIIGELFLWREMDPRETLETDASVSEEDLKDFVGRYDYGAAVLIVTRQGKQLSAQLTGQPALPIYPKSKDEFFWKVVEARVKFVRDGKGDVIHAIHYQGGQEIKAPRLPDEKVVEVSPEVLKTYAGNYSYGPATMTVTVEKNRIFAQLTGQPRWEIFPKSQNTFFWNVVQAEVSFLKGEDGKIEKAHHKQGGREFDAPRIE